GVFPGESVDEARAALTEAVAGEAAKHPWLAAHPPVVEWFEGQFDPGETPVSAPIVRSMSAAHAAVAGSPPRVRGMTAGTDLRLFTRYAGIPTVMYGPGELAQAHAADESVS